MLILAARNLRARAGVREGALLLALALVVASACVAAGPPQPTASPTLPPPPSFDPASVTPTPLPTIPIGRAVGVTGDRPPPGMVRLVGRTIRADEQPATRVCVSLGPPGACALLTDDEGTFMIEVPQGPIEWELNFTREGQLAAVPVRVTGPFITPTFDLGPVRVSD